MKKKYLVSALVLTIILLIGCGKKDASNSAGSDERIEIVCLSCRPNDQLDEDIIEFNNSQTKYKVVKREYDADADEKINLDIAQGNYPDLYDVSEGGKNCDRCGAYHDRDRLCLYSSDLLVWRPSDRLVNPDDRTADESADVLYDDHDEPHDACHDLCYDHHVRGQRPKDYRGDQRGEYPDES